MNNTRNEEPEEIIIHLRWGCTSTKTKFKAGDFRVVGVETNNGKLTHLMVKLKPGMPGMEEIEMKILMDNFWEEN